MPAEPDYSCDIFTVSGPKHMMMAQGGASSQAIDINWKNEEHRRCIIACLVKGTYVLQSDRTERRGQQNALAPAWWESFHFRRRDDYRLECECGCVLCKPFGGAFIYGAVFEYEPPHGQGHHPPSPRYVVAFRGTMLLNPAAAHDMCGNLGILRNKQHKCDRFTHARRMVQKLLVADNDGVWLAGHSLGASIALDVGRHMMTSSELGFVNLPTFLFNPPHVSLAPVIPEGARPIVHDVGDSMKYVLGKLKLNPWAPNLYVNPRDALCVGFIHYFERRERRTAEHRGHFRDRVAATASTLSLRDMSHSAVGRQGEQQHLLPSAVVCKNTSQDCEAHGLRQWWLPQGPNLVLTYRRHSWH
ncbi:hypothetical protein BS78_K310100 [Paspalum vaginatum]|uniref:Fungal lipase-like domain-containing protein n=1 Tax=Paspalum vaginatum TaxID=158149 RepID=A0A9W7X999_9POAL|nr:hypothetical protein BS78_K310100 [Paspalum vaginatum]